MKKIGIFTGRVYESKDATLDIGECVVAAAGKDDDFAVNYAKQKRDECCPGCMHCEEARRVPERLPKRSNKAHEKRVHPKRRSRKRKK